MIYTITFLAGLVLTVVLMVATIVAGWRARRRRHVILALSTVGMLAATVAFAVLMAKYERQLPPHAMAVHKYFSLTVAYTIPVVALTGIGLWHMPAFRWPHRLSIGVLLIGTLGAAGTGFWVLAVSSPLRG